MNTDTSQETAATFRENHGLGLAPIDDLVEVIESLPGVHVAIEPGQDDGQHGMRATDPARGVTILAATATSNAVRLRSTLAHELGHHLYDDPTPPTWSERTWEESRATTFARHLLIPPAALTLMFGGAGEAGNLDEADLSQVVKRFRVSPSMAAIQLCEYGFIDEATTNEFRGISTQRLATRHGWLATYRSWAEQSSRPRPPRRVAEAAINAYIAGETPLSTVANIHGVTTTAMAEALAEAEIAPRAVSDNEPRASG